MLDIKPTETSILHVNNNSFTGPLITGGFRETGPWGPFLESPGNFTGPKSNIQIEI